jgi:hypothetical protein
MALLFDEGEKHLSTLPPFNPLPTEPLTVREKTNIALRLLREAAIASRQSKSRPFYSIRAVAKHFSLPTSTVIRLYGRLKTEGVLGSIWGSGTIVEPTHLDNDIRLKAMVALPVPMRAFSVIPSYRLFIRSMQRDLWRERFSSQIIFYEEPMFDASAVTDAVLQTGSDLVVWLVPPARMASAFSKLKDRGIKSLIITDEMPIDGGSGYYLDWQGAVIRGLEDWKRSGHRMAVVIKNTDSDTSSILRLLPSCLAKVGLDFDVRETWELRPSQRSASASAARPGVIFISAQSLIRLAQAGVRGIEDLLRHNRVLFIHGGVDLLFQTHINRCFDTIKFNWSTISRRIVSDLITSPCGYSFQKQTIFRGKWHSDMYRK